MLGLERRLNITLLYSHLKHKVITFISDLSSILILGWNDLNKGKAYKNEVIEWLKWLHCSATLFGRETQVYSRSCFCYCLCSASFSVLIIKFFKTLLLGEQQGKGRKSSVHRCTDPSSEDGGLEGVVSVQILEHFILWIALQKVHWTENRWFPWKVECAQKFPMESIKIVQSEPFEAKSNATVSPWATR